MIAGHVMGLPIEESFLQLVAAPAGATTVAVVAFAGRAKLARVVARIRKRERHFA